jgi:hypothetical protein
LTTSRRTSGSKDSLLELLVSPSTWPEWQAEIRSVSGPDRIDHGDAVHGDAQLLGFAVKGRSDATLVDGGIVEEDVIVGVRMRVRYEVRSDSNGAVVTRNLIADLPGGFMGRMLSFFLARRLRKMQDDVLDRLVAIAAQRPQVSGSGAVGSD